MSNLLICQAILLLNPSIVNLNDFVAYDINGQEVTYDRSAAEAKAAELQAEEIAKQEAAVAAKESAISKLTALGLTADEVKVLLGTT